MTVIHEKSFPGDYITSLSNQRYQEFDLVIFIHNAPVNIINRFIAKLNNTQNLKYHTRIFKIPSQLTIPQAREYLFKKLVDLGYKNVILTDSDDFYTPTHVETMLDVIENHDIAVTDSFVYISNNDYIYDSAMRMRNNLPLKTLLKGLVPKTISWDFILNKNCLGFGNTALNLDCIEEIPHFPENILAVDWWFYTNQMYISGITARFTEKITSFYRIHEENTAGFFEITEGFLRRGINIKVLHYCYLTNLDPIFKELCEKFLITKEYFEKDSHFRMIYLKRIELLYANKQFLWWEPIKDYIEVMNNEDFKNCKNWRI